MKVIETDIKGCFLIEPQTLTDQRGYFFESFNKRRLEKALNTSLNFVQDNHSFSEKGVLRGLHFQKAPHAQTKLVRVVSGEALDVVVDVRKESTTFGQHFKTRLSAENKRMLYIPAGMAHGFLALKANTIFLYKCDNYYHPDSEAGIAFNDPELNIDWGFPESELILSEKDRQLPFLKAIES